MLLHRELQYFNDRFASLHSHAEVNPQARQLLESIPEVSEHRLLECGSCIATTGAES